MKTTLLQIEETGALGESAHLQKALEAVPGVQSVRVEAEAGRATIEHENADEQKLVAAIKAAGHEAKLIPDDAEVLSPPVPQMNSTTEGKTLS